MVETRDVTHQEIIARLEKIKNDIKIIGNENKLIYMYQKEESKFLFKLTLILSVGFSLLAFLPQEYYFIIGIIGIILIFVAIIYYFIWRNKVNDLKEDLRENAIRVYKSRGLSDEKIRQLLDEDYWIFH